MPSPIRAMPRSSRPGSISVKSGSRPRLASITIWKKALPSTNAPGRAQSTPMAESISMARKRVRRSAGVSWTAATTGIGAAGAKPGAGSKFPASGGGSAGVAGPPNSGKSPRRRNSISPASLALVSRLARPALIQLRSCSAEAGPYSLPSPPMMVNMAGRQQRGRRWSIAGGPKRSEVGFVEAWASRPWHF